MNNVAATAQPPQALEAAAQRHLAGCDPAAAGRALAAARDAWRAQDADGTLDQQAHCGLLAAAAWRTAGDLPAAAAALAALQALPLPPPLRQAAELEACEQRLAAGEAVAAEAAFAAFVERHAAALALPLRAVVHQRHAAAALAAGAAGRAADALLQAASLLDEAGAPADAEACRLAACSALVTLDPGAAEALWQHTVASMPTDGAAAYRRQRAGARIAIQRGDGAQALQRLDAARQAALDVGDPLAYAEAAIEASRVARQGGQADLAYARLATAWATLSDRIGRDAAAQLMRPALQALRDALGSAAFAAAKAGYEHARRSTPRSRA